MKFKTLYFNPLRECCHILWDETDRSCIVVDPGCSGAGEFARLQRFVQEQSLKPVRILLTHGHFDHFAGVKMAAAYWNIPAMMHPDDAWQLKYTGWFAEEVGMEKPANDFPWEPLQEGMVIPFGDAALSVLHTPGHSPGSVCFYDAGANLLLSGDTLFQGSVGRTDLPKGNPEQMMKSIARLAQLPPETVVLPGHGYPTTIGEECRSNPFFTVNGQYR